MYRILRHIFSVLLVFGISSPRGAFCEEELSEIRRMTTHPAMDFAPAISPDGRWLAFTSERSGNLDIWIKEIPRGGPVQVTMHQAEDAYPAWSPDGKHLTFVSKRRDAQGDIWLVALDMRRGGAPKGVPEQVTDYLGIDAKPTFSRDGRRIVFTSDRDGMLNLWSVEIGSKNTRRLTTSGGTDPTASPLSDWIVFTSYRSHPQGDLLLIDEKNPENEETKGRAAYPITWGEAVDGKGAWSPDGKEVVFLRFDRDTNGDGKIDPNDNGSLWKKRLSEEGEILPERIVLGRGEIQITTEVYDDFEPCWSSKGEILFTSNRGGGMDVWAVPEEGIIGRRLTAIEQYSSVFERFGTTVTKEALYQSILGFQRVPDYFPGDSVWVARALIQMGEVYHVLEDRIRTRKMFERVSRDYTSQKMEAARADLKIASSAEDSIGMHIERCRSIVESFPAGSSVSAEAWIVLGDLFRKQGNVGESLSAYGSVIRLSPKLRNLRAQAQLSIGDLLKEAGQEETARQSYFLVLREFEDVPLWRQRAIARLLDFVGGSLQDRIRGYQEIVQEASEFPSLAAEAQLAIGRTLEDHGLHAQAIRELERVAEIAPSLAWAHAESKILQARIFGMMGDELKGRLLLEEVMGSYGSIEGGRFIPAAEDALFSLFFHSAETLKDSEDFVLAEARYRRAMQLREDDIRVHRGLVESMYHAGKVDAIVLEYENGCKENPNNPIYLYGLGLALSYKGEDKPEYLNKSNIYLNQALEENYRLIYPYRTLGFNYELLEQIAEEKARQKSSLIVRMGRTVAAPLRWLIGLLPFGGGEKKEGYYEKAIEALTTALELNDESSDPRMEAQLAQNLANNFYHLGEYGYKKAYEYYQLRLSIDTTFVRPLEKAVFYERMGHCGAIVEDTEKAARVLQNAIRLFAQEGQDMSVLRNERMLAFLYHLAGRYEEAIVVYEKTVARDERHGHRDDVQRDYRNIAYNYYLMGEPEDALKYARKAESILQKKEIPIEPPKKNSLRVEAFGFSIPVWGMEEIGGASAEGFSPADELTLVYGLMSKSHEAVKAFPYAVEYELKRLDIFQKRKDRLAERIALNRLGKLAYKMSDYEEAWAYFYRSWEACKKKSDVRGRFVNAVNLGNVATVELSQRKAEDHAKKAIACLDEELKRVSSDEKNTTVDERLSLFNTLGTLWMLLGKRIGQEVDSENLRDCIGKALSKIGCYERAGSYFQECLETAKRNGRWREEGIVLKNLAELAESVHDDSASYAYLKESRRLFEKGGDEEHLWRVLYSTANLLMKSADPDSVLKIRGAEALATYELAMDCLENLPVEEEGSEERLSDRDDRWHLYVDAAFAMVKSGLAERALETVERGREKSAADFLARRPPQLKRERHKIAWGNVRYVRSRLQEVRRRMAEEESRLHRESSLAGLRAQEENYEQEYGELRRKLRDEDGVLAYLSGALPVDLDGVRSVLAQDAAALCYLVGSDRTLLWVVDSDSIRVAELPIEASLLRSKVNAYLNALEGDSLDDRMSCELYDNLLRPAEAFIENKTTLIVVPDDFLWNVPLGALSDGNEYLIDKTGITTASSLTAYRLAWERRKINLENGVLVGDEQDEDLLHSFDRTGIKTESFLGPRATETAFREALKSTDVAQVERWVILDENDPLISAIVLFPEADDDGFLQAQELFSYDLRTSLCFLPPPRGTVKWGAQNSSMFYYGFLYGGVPSVVITTWSVDRDVKRIFFDVFYRYLKDRSFSDAMGNAQLAVRKRFPDIKAWAGFRLMGFEGMNSDERTRFAENNLISTVRKGRIFEQRGDYVDAVETFERAQDMAEMLGDSFIVHRIYDEIRRVSVKGELWETAAFYQKRLQTAFQREDDKNKIQTGLERIVAYFQMGGQFDKAAQAQKEYVAFVREGGDWEALASAYEGLAYVYAEDRNYKEANVWVEEAFRLYKERGDVSGQGRALIRKGRFLLEADDYWQARRDLSEGVSLLEGRVSPSDENNRVELASGYQLLGLACENLTRYEEAFEYQRKGRVLFDELGRSLQAAQGLQYEANLFWKTGNYRKGLSYQEDALKAFESLKNTKLLAVAKSTQGLLFLGLGNLAEAKKAEEEALRLAEEGGHLEDQATILKNVGLVAIQEGDYNGANVAFLRASRIDSALGVRSGLAYDYRNLGNLLVRMERTEEGIAYLERGLRLSKEIGDLRNEVQCYYGLGQAYSRLREERTALALLDTALSMTSDLILPELEWRIFRQRAGVSARLGRDERALEDFRKAVDIVETMRAELKVEAYKQGFLDDKMDLYFDVVRHTLKMGNEAEAYYYVERAKSRSFIDLLANQDLFLTQTQGELLRRERERKLAVQEAQERLGSFRRRGESLSAVEQDEKSRWEKELEDRRSAYEGVLVSIQAESPELASFVRVDPWRLDKIQTLLPDSTAIVEYLLTDNELFTWVVSRGKVAVKRMNIQERVVQETVKRF
ncbi:MAG: tetratricopeptide repeat protein, partial [bacterium]